MVFYGGIPPWVKMHHVVGTGQVQTQTAGLEADQEQGHIAGLEFLYEPGALLGIGAAVEIVVEWGAVGWALLFVERLAYQGQMTGELTEHKGTVTTLAQFGYELKKGLGLARGYP